MQVVVKYFYQEILDDATLEPMFADVSVAALEVHQIKLFLVIYGPGREKPDRTEYLNFMLATHTRLFRDHGLNERHFDAVAVCLVKALRSLEYSTHMIDECTSELAPLRIVFEYGAKVAEQEKGYTTEQMQTLPTATAVHLLDTTRDRVLTVLPNLAWIDVPDCLSTNYLAKHSLQGSIRLWTDEGIDRSFHFGSGYRRYVPRCAVHESSRLCRRIPPIGILRSTTDQEWRSSQQRRNEYYGHYHPHP